MWLLFITSLSLKPAPYLIPLNRPPPALTCASKTSETEAPNVKSAKPTIPAQIFDFPYFPLALIAAIPLTNSVSPIERICIGPPDRYIAAHSRNTVATML